ncbi:MAG: hypothetical protein AB8B53_01850 [Flavobacteriales bacterium]
MFFSISTLLSQEDEDGFQTIFSTETDAPPISYNYSSFLEMKSKRSKKLTGIWLSDKGHILIFNKDKTYGDHLNLPHNSKYFNDPTVNQVLNEIECFMYWKSDRATIRFFKLENDRLESDREKAFLKYKVTRNKLFILLDYKDNWRKKDENVLVLKRVDG